MYIRKNLLIYVVEDNIIYNRLVCEHLKKQNYTKVKSFNSGNECIKSVINGECPDIVIQDYHLDDINGIDVLLAVKKRCKNSEFIFFTANEDVEVAVNTIKYGAYDYIIKDSDVAFEKVEDKIEKISKMIRLERKNQFIRMTMIISILVLIIIIIGLLLLLFNVSFGLSYHRQVV